MTNIDILEDVSGVIELNRRRLGDMINAMDYRNIITVEPDKRGGKPCIRSMRITVYDVLEYLAGGMSERDIINDFPELTTDDIHACLQFAADRERRLLSIPALAILTNYPRPADSIMK